MEFIENITAYYTTESRHRIYSAITGILVIIVGIALWYFSQSESIQKTKQ